MCYRAEPIILNDDFITPIFSQRNKYKESVLEKIILAKTAELKKG